MNGWITLDHEALDRAQSEGVLSPDEAFALDALAEQEGDVPEWLFAAVERLFLWCADAAPLLH